MSENYLEAAWIEGTSYAVWSEDPQTDGNQGKIHIATIETRSCSCEHGEKGNNNGQPESCKHLRCAIETRAEPRTNLTVNNEIPATANPSQSTQTDTDDSQSESSAAVDEMAEYLQNSYDAVIPDMQVKTHNGRIWVQTGQDTPDTLDVPGNPSVFDVFLKNAEQIEYVHENHDLHSQKPGEWWKNTIAAGDVEEYVEEVLQ
jgi:hypothetical protein